MKIFKILLAIIATALLQQSSYAYIKLSSLFTSNMVLQQKSQCPIWGWGEPGEVVKITAQWGAETEATVDADGRWNTVLITPSYGGPYELTFEGSNTIVLKNILIGDVYLACGDSNMNLAMMGSNGDTVTNGLATAQKAANSNIRFFGVGSKASFDKIDNVEAFWFPDMPYAMPHCSALAYFFAKKLNTETGVPIGIITASWPGSNAESWISMEYLSKIPDFEDRIKEYDQSVPNQSKLLKWIKSHPTLDMRGGLENAPFDDEECARMGYDDSQWPSTELPNYFPEHLNTFEGTIWFRKWVTIPEEWQEKQLILSLGPIDDMDVAYVNGEPIGKTIASGRYSQERYYKILPGLVRAGRLLIAVRVINNEGNGGIYGRSELLKIYPEGEENNPIPITGTWKYLPNYERCEGEFYKYDHRKMEYNERPHVTVTLSNKTITGAYRAMIEPLMPFKICGSLWCHNESNLGRSEEYYRLLPQLVECWREGFQNPSMKFYYWQATPYDYQNGEASYELREAQRRCLDIIPNSAMVSLMDLGSKTTRRPPSKQDAAERMARVAMHDLYGKKTIETSGPMYESMEIDKSGKSIVLTFSHTTGGLQVRGEGLTDFEIAGNDGVYHAASASIQGNKVIVSSPEVNKPKNVRYAWKDWVESPSLYNGAGLPASSFSTEKTITQRVK